MENKNWLSIYQESNDILSDIIYELYNLSDAFLNTGNSFIYKKIKKIAINLEYCKEGFEKSKSLNFDENLKAAKQSSANILNTCLAMSKLNKEE